MDTGDEDEEDEDDEEDSSGSSFNPSYSKKRLPVSVAGKNLPRQSYYCTIFLLFIF